MLEIRHLSAGYGHGPVIDNLSMSVARGETVALLGPNGAGKSTLVNALSGTVPVRNGQALLDGDNLVARTSDAIVRRGLVQVPEGRRMFAPMPVLDNLMLGSITLPGGKHAADEQLQRVFKLFPRLAERRHQAAGTLSGGEQQMVAIGRALMSKPRLLLLDEPFLGLAPRVVEEILQALDVMRQDGLTMLLVEQKLDIALPFTQRAFVLIKGRIALQQASAELASRDNLESLYFELADAAAA
jgi:branched-chain amino acid transport system ATP-binding protein